MALPTLIKVTVATSSLNPEINHGEIVKNLKIETKAPGYKSLTHEK